MPNTNVENVYAFRVKNFQTLKFYLDFLMAVLFKIHTRIKFFDIIVSADGIALTPANHFIS